MAMWRVSDKGDPALCKLADRHYTRQSPGSPQWTRPGFNFVLTHYDKAVFVWWRPKWEANINRMDGLRAIECTIFRNESSTLSSSLIFEACEWLASYEAIAALKLDPIKDAPDGLITGVSSEKTNKRRSKHSLPGKCFREAGFVEFAHAKGMADIWLRRYVPCMQVVE